MKVLAWIFFIPTLSFANGGGYISGVKHTGAFQPIGIEQVEMVSERLEIDLHIEYADIRIEYILHNPGNKIKVEAGFPSAIAVNTMGLDREKPTIPQPKLEDFALSVDGKSAKVTQTDDKLDLSKHFKTFGMTVGSVVNSWHRVKMDFAEGQTRKVNVRYRNPYYYSTFGVSEHGSTQPLSLTYLFSAAGAWKGPIGQGIVTVTNISAPEKQISFSHPKRFVKDGKGWTWSFTDFEPTLEDDLVIITHAERAFVPMVISVGDETEWIGFNYGYGTRKNPTDGLVSGGRWDLHRTDFTASASSSLPSTDGHSYHPSEVNDGGTGSAWTEGVPGNGEGESLTLTLKRPSPVKRLGIVNGYAKSEELYYANGRPAELDVSVNGGKAARVSIPDEFLSHEHFFFDLPIRGELVKTIKLTIAKVYPGQSYQDTAISEIVLVQPLSKPPKIEPVR